MNPPLTLPIVIGKEGKDLRFVKSFIVKFIIHKYYFFVHNFYFYIISVNPHPLPRRGPRGGFC